jgi:hypothetical protein
MFLMFIAVGLVVVTVAIHAAEFSALIRTMTRSHALDRYRASSGSPYW